MPDEPPYRYIQDDTGRWFRVPAHRFQEAKDALDVIARYWAAIRYGDDPPGDESPNVPDYLTECERPEGLGH